MEKRILQSGQKIVYYRINGIERPICEFNSDYETELLKIGGGKNLVEEIRYEHPFAIMLRKENQGEKSNSGFLKCFKKKRQPYLSITIPHGNLNGRENTRHSITASPFTYYEREGNKIILIGGRAKNFAIEFQGIDLESVLRDGYNKGINDREDGIRLFPRLKNEK